MSKTGVNSVLDGENEKTEPQISFSGKFSAVTKVKGSYSFPVVMACLCYHIPH